MRPPGVHLQIAGATIRNKEHSYRNKGAEARNRKVTGRRLAVNALR